MNALWGLILNSFHWVSPCSKTVRNIYRKKEKREDKIEDEITVSQGFRSQKHFNHIGKFGHSLHTLFTYTM